MSRKLARKPRIAIVGAGNLARALAVSLRVAGYEIDQIISQKNAASLRRAQRLARQVGAAAVAMAPEQIESEIVWFCVPDAAIRSVATRLALAGNWKGKVALHSSGALTGDELSSLSKRGAKVASVHPLMTFVRGSQPSFAGVPFAIEGNPQAVQAARAIVFSLHGKPFAIEKKHKAAYHCWGMFASPLLDALLVTSERIAHAAGVERAAARERMLPILRQTLENYAAFGAAGAFSGPIVRGDVETVKKHLRVLGGVPGALEVYVALARMALHDLPARNRTTLKKLLSG
jgi:predicted short-subunit dehydrogenase-like oxidoreductase (DUF2520 family)